MRATECNQIVRIVAATFGTRTNMVNIQVARVPAAWNRAALLIPTKHRSARRGWDGLLRAAPFVTLRRNRARVGAADARLGSKASWVARDDRGDPRDAHVGVLARNGISSGRRASVVARASLAIRDARVVGVRCVEGTVDREARIVRAGGAADDSSAGVGAFEHIALGANGRARVGAFAERGAFV